MKTLTLLLVASALAIQNMAIAGWIPQIAATYVWGALGIHLVALLGSLFTLWMLSSAPVIASQSVLHKNEPPK